MNDQPSDEVEKRRGSSRSLFALVALVIVCVIGVVVLQSRTREHRPQVLTIGMDTSRVLKPTVDSEIDFLGALNQSASPSNSLDDCLASTDNAFIDILSRSELSFSEQSADFYSQAMELYQFDMSAGATK